MIHRLRCSTHRNSFRTLAIGVVCALVSTFCASPAGGQAALSLTMTVTTEGGPCPGGESLAACEDEWVKYCCVLENTGTAAALDVMVRLDNGTPLDDTDDYVMTSQVLTGLTNEDGDDQVDDLAAGAMANGEALRQLDTPGTVTITARAEGRDETAGTWVLSAEDSATASCDTAPPGAPSMPDLDPASDSGSSRSDDVTNVRTPTFTGTAEANSAVRVYANAVEAGTGAAGGDGEWAITIAPLADGVHAISATATDACGNTSPASLPLSLRVDTQAPNVPDDRSPADGTRTNDTTPTLSWDEPSDPGGSGINNYRVQVTGPSPKDYYTSGTSYTPSLAPGTHSWTVYARDHAGNKGTESDSRTLIIDTTPPTVAIGASDTMLTDADAGDRWTITFAFSEAMDPLVDPTIQVAPVAPELFAGSPEPPAWSAGNTVYTVSFTLGDCNDAQASVGVTCGGAQDVAGNVLSPNPTAASGAFGFDMANPTVTAVSISDTLITDSDDGDLVMMTVTFSEPMDLTAEPQSPFFTPPVDSTMRGGRIASWGDPTTYVVGFDVHDVDVDVDSVTIGVERARDANGNYQQRYVLEHALGIDTLNPTATGIALSDTRISDADAGGTFTVTADFSEAMTTDGSADPIIAFSPAVGTALAFASENWPNSDTYMATYAVSDAGVDHDSVTIDVSGAKDANGNDQQNYTPEHEFEIDTLNPTVTSVEVSDPLVTDKDADNWTALPFDVRAVFSEAMDAGAPPTLTYSPAVPQTLPAVPKVQTWETINTYLARYDPNDAGVDRDSVTIDVTGARDLAGNPQQDYTPEHEFGIDTLNPTVTAVSVSDTLITDADAGGTFAVTVDFSKAMTTDGSADPIIAFSPAAGTTLAFASESWPDSGTYTVTYDISDAGVVYDDVTIGTLWAKDANGNYQQNYVLGHAFGIDTLNPTATSIALGDTLVTDADIGGTFTVTVDFSEPMQSGTAPTIVFMPELGTTLSSLGSSGWSDFDTYVARYAILDGGVTVDKDDVHVSLACDAAGNMQAPSSLDDDLDVDTASPIISEQTVTGGPVDDSCVRAVTFGATATDPDGCMDPDDVVITSATVVTGNASIGLPYDIVRGGAGNTATISGRVDVYDLTGCSATVRIVFDATDCAGNSAQQVQAEDDVYDEAIPTINDLWVTPMMEVDATCCFATVAFSANVTDNRCVQAGNVTATVTLPTANAILENVVVNATQDAQGRVDVTGTADVRCLTSCPARVSVRIEAFDCCGNEATSASSLGTEGLVIDATRPEVEDDSDRIREDTPTRIYVLENDDDNCTRKWEGKPCRCDGVVHIYDIPNPPDYGVVAIEDELSHIRYAPFQDCRGTDQFTYRVIDACGNISPEATVSITVVAKLAMADSAYRACRETPLSIELRATDPLISEKDAPLFRFTILDGPAHGVLVGDVATIHYQNPETAWVAPLSYVPSAGFVGQDQIGIKFEDPYAESSTAAVDIAVEDCVGQGTPLQVARGVVLPAILPASFASVYEQGWTDVTLAAENGDSVGGALREQTLSVVWNATLGRHVLLLDTGPLPLERYLLTIPLGNGEAVPISLWLQEAE